MSMKFIKSDPKKPHSEMDNPGLKHLDFGSLPVQTRVQTPGLYK